MISSTARALSRTLDNFRPVWAGLIVAVLVLPAPERLPLSREHVIFLTTTGVLLWFMAGWADRLWWRATPLDLPWLIWLLLIPVTLWATAVPDLTHATLRLFAGQAIAFWTLVIWTRTRQRASWAAFGLLALGAALAFLGLFWMEWPRGYIFPVPAVLQRLREQYPLPIQESVNKNVLAGVLVPLLGLALAAVPAPRGRWRWPLRGLAALAVVTIGGMVVLSQSRGSWMAALTALYVLIALSWRPAWAGVVLGPVALLVLHWQGQLLPLLTRTLALQQGKLVGRYELWSRALYAAQDFVFTGIGMGTFPKVVPLLYPLFLYGPNAELTHAHNLLLQVMVDLGVFGLIAFLAMIGITALLIHRGMNMASPEDRSLVWILRGSAAGLSAALVHGLVDAIAWNTRPAFLIWALWGLAVGTALTLCTRNAHRAIPPAGDRAPQEKAAEPHR